MPKAWKIVATTKPVDGQPHFTPQTEYFLVAAASGPWALTALRNKRGDLEGADIVLVGQASPEFIDWLRLKDGQVLSITVL